MPETLSTPAQPQVVGLWGPARAAAELQRLQAGLGEASLPAEILSQEDLVHRSREGALAAAVLLWPPGDLVWPPPLRQETFVLVVHRVLEPDAVRAAADFGAVASVSACQDPGAWIPHLAALWRRSRQRAQARQLLADQRRDELVRGRVCAAVGILCERHGESIDAAYRRLRDLSRLQRRPVEDVAQDLCHPPAAASPPSSRRSAQVPRR